MEEVWETFLSKKDLPDQWSLLLNSIPHIELNFHRFTKNWCPPSSNRSIFRLFHNLYLLYLKILQNWVISIFSYFLNLCFRIRHSQCSFLFQNFYLMIRVCLQSSNTLLPFFLKFFHCQISTALHIHFQQLKDLDSNQKVWHLLVLLIYFL